MENKKNILAITPDTKVGELLEAYPGLENVLIKIAPVFTKLRNPVLRKTIARVTSLRQAASVGSVPLGEMITRLRAAAGLDTHEADSFEEWTNKGDFKVNNPVITYDARTDLENGIHPVGKVMTELNSIKTGEIYLLITPFTPAPLIDIAKGKGFIASSRKAGDNKYETYFSR